MTNTRAELAAERVGLVARAIEREAEECGFSIFSDDAESIARAVLSALRGQGEGWQAIETAPHHRPVLGFADGVQFTMIWQADRAGARLKAVVEKTFGPQGYTADPDDEAEEGWFVWGYGLLCRKPDGRLFRVHPTAWRPLPAPPSQTGGDDGR